MTICWQSEVNLVAKIGLARPHLTITHRASQILRHDTKILDKTSDKARPLLFFEQDNHMLSQQRTAEEYLERPWSMDKLPFESEE